MIIVRAKGRLGNQLFFLAAAAKARVRKSELIVGAGFQDLSPYFRRRHRILARVALFGKAAWRLLRADRLISVGQNLGLIGSISVHREREFVRTKSVLGVWVMAAEYFQRQSLVDVSIVRKLRDAFLKKNERRLIRPHIETYEKRPPALCFVHIRRGDYAAFPSREHPAVLPKQWFFEKINEVKGEEPATLFLAFSDDQTFCEDNFSAVERLVLVDLDPFESFVAMSLCDQGILSPSSLSWWAACLAWENSRGHFRAPQFWFWWPQNRWLDDTLRDSNFLEWEFVNSQNPSDT